MNWLDKLKFWNSNENNNEPGKLFHVGQDITPKSPIEWVDKLNHNSRIGPRFGDVVTVLSYDHYTDGLWFIKISGYPDFNYDESWFAPVITDDELEELLNEVDELTLKQHE